MRGRIILAWWILLWPGLLAGQPVLPVYVEENHAGSFYFLAQKLELEREHTLVLVDAHSDASATPDSDEVRRGIRRVGSADQLSGKLQAWRRAGRIQANGWLEPLMPRPVAKVLWVGGEERGSREREARRLLDGRLEGEPRRCGALGERFEGVGWGELPARLADECPVIASLDLDAFSGLEPSEAKAKLGRVVERILALPRLAAVTVAVSRPWLQSDAEADRLLEACLREFSTVQNAELHFEPFGHCGPDRTRLAKESLAAGSLPPRFLVANAGGELRRALLDLRERLVVHFERDRWERLLDEWEGQQAGWFLAVDGAQPSTDGVVRVDRDAAAAVRLRGGSGGTIRKVRWFQRKPEKDCYNVLPRVLPGKSFSGEAGGWVRDREVPVAETAEPALAAEAWTRLASNGLGVIRLRAEVEDGTGSWSTPVLEVRLREGEGFHAGLAEQFGLPYVFGAGFLRGDDCDGPETGWGNDCANFLVYAWRRTGRRLPWCNPAQLRRHLAPVGVVSQSGDALPLTNGSVERGVVVHLGNHVAAVWRDVAPVGILTGADELVHHLGGVPEVVTLKALMSARQRQQVDVLMLPESEEAFTVAFGGDVNFAGLDGGEERLAASLPEELTSADFAMVNLECVLAEGGQAAGKRYRFRASPKWAGLLREAGIDAVSLANNHAGDFGAEGLRAMLRTLQAGGIATSGAGNNLAEALGAVVVENDAAKVAVLTATMVKPEGLPAGADRAGVVSWPEHEEVFLRALRGMAGEFDSVIVFMHWGDEYTGTVTDAQRHLARRLINAGAAAVVGAHSHHPQMADTWRGRPVVYSLGNLLFPGQGPNQGFRRISVARLAFSRDGSLGACRVTTRPRRSR